MDAALIVIVIVIALAFLAIGVTTYTRRGSGIAEHPLDVREGAPGARGRSESTGQDAGEGSPLDTRGTR